MEHRRWEEDVKDQLVNFLPVINNTINKNVTENDIRKIDCKDIYKNMSSVKDIELIKEKIKDCKSPSEFAKKYNKEYSHLIKSKQLHLLDNIRTKRKSYTKEEILHLCKNISDRSIFIKDHFWLYYRCSKLNILKQATNHMNKITGTYQQYTDNELLTFISPEWVTTNDLKKNNSPLHREIIKRNLINQCNFKETGHAVRAKAKFKNQEYFDKHIVPLIQQGLTIYKIYKQKLLPMTYNIMNEMLHTFGTKECMQQHNQNKKTSYINKKR